MIYHSFRGVSPNINQQKPPHPGGAAILEVYSWFLNGVKAGVLILQLEHRWL